MIAMTAREIAATVGGELLGGDPGRTPVRVVIDSRNVSSGDMFVAIVGPRDDGHRYLQQALAAGAVALLLQRREVAGQLVNADAAALILVPDTTVALQALASHVRDLVAPTVVAITGSVGKTTVKTLTYELLRHEQPTHATPGNLNNQWGLPLSLLGLEPQHRWMVAELGMSHAGEIRSLARLARPQVGVITNIAAVHMENFDSLEGVAAAKRELAEELPADGVLIVSADDPRTAAIGAQLAPRLARVIEFGDAGEVTARDARADDGGWQLLLVLPGEDAVPVRLPLPGSHSLSNFLAAAAAAHAFGIPAERIAKRAPQLVLPAMRGRVLHAHDDITVLDDTYNASPAAMMRALETLAALPGDGRLVLAAGDMLELGAWAEEAHREVGLHAAQLGFDLVVTVGPLARDIGHGARAGGMPESSVVSVSGADDAAAIIPELLRPRDRLLVKGSRGVRMEKIIRALFPATAEAH